MNENINLLRVMIPSVVIRICTMSKMRLPSRITLGNLPTYTRCKLKNILPLAAIPTRLLRDTGDGILVPVLSQFAPFASDTGVDIQIYDKRVRKFRGEVVVALLDHKAAHELGGFFTAFNNMKRFCRHCLLHHEDISTTDRTKFIPRTPDVHDAILYIIENGDYIEGIQKLYAVSKYPVLHSIPRFHVIVKLPPDLMHTELEGELKRELCMFLERVVQKHRWFAMDKFNTLLTVRRADLGLKKYLPESLTDKFLGNVASNELTAGQVYSLALFYRSFVLCLIHGRNTGYYRI